MIGRREIAFQVVRCGVIVQHLLLNCGPIAHMAHGDVRSPLRGDDLQDRADNVFEAGLAILIKDGIVSQIGESEQLNSEYSGDSSIDLITDVEGHAVVPGFVDSHTHLLWAGDRSNEMRLRQSGLSYQDIASKGGGINKTVSATRKSPPLQLFDSGMSRIRRAINFGTTTMECKSGYGLSTESELRLLEIIKQLQEKTHITIHPTWLGAHDFPKEHTQEEYMEQLISQQLPAIVEQGIAEWTDVFCEPGWYSLEQTEEIVRAAEGQKLPSRLHVDEFVDGGGLGLAAELGCASGDHVGHSSDEARSAAAEAGTMQTFLPGTPYVLGKKLELPLQHCLDENWQFSLATDFNPNCRSLSIPFVGSLATHRIGISPLAALAAVTRNPATSLIRNEDDLVAGSIREGGPGDLLILSSNDPDSWCQTPGDNPVAITIIKGSIEKS